MNNNKICFVSTYIGTEQLKDISDNFKKIEGIDYLFFTNLNIKNNSWKIININTNDLKLDNSVKISRYYKFNVKEYLKDQYDFYFYCDSYLYPDPNVDWIKICENIKKSSFGIIQYKHPRKNASIENDIRQISRGKKDKEINMQNFRKYLLKIKNINLKNPLYFENTVFGVNLKDKKVIDFLDEFWKYYIDSPTYRDQPLWNFLYLKNNLKPLIDIDFRKNFLGCKKIERHLNEYNLFKNNELENISF